MAPLRISALTDWVGHTPFAFALMEWHRPQVLVELGTRTGVSYCAFCQAVQLLALPTKCYAVDTWKGDDHSGFYSEEIFSDFNEYHEANYKGFSSLMRMTFDEALDSFSDGSIDLLHIDGLHYYEAVKHDFETWLPKMSSRGIILLHDTAMRGDGFGVWRLLEEIQQTYTVFEFLHSYGLGVVAMDVSSLDARLASLFQASDEVKVIIRNFFESLGRLNLLEDRKRKFDEALEQFEGLTHRLGACESARSSMKTSWSWRITYPLRRVYDLFTGTKQERE